MMANLNFLRTQLRRTGYLSFGVAAFNILTASTVSAMPVDFGGNNWVIAPTAVEAELVPAVQNPGQEKGLIICKGQVGDPTGNPGSAQGFNPQPDPPGVVMPTDQKSLNFTNQGSERGFIICKTGVGDPTGMPTDQKGFNFSRGAESAQDFHFDQNQGAAVDSFKTQGAAVDAFKGGPETPGAAQGSLNFTRGAAQGLIICKAPGGNTGNGGVPIYMNQGIGNAGGEKGVPIYMNPGMNPGNAGGRNGAPIYMNQGTAGLVNPGGASGAPIFMNQGPAAGVGAAMHATGGGGGAGMPIFMNQGGATPGGTNSTPIFMNTGGGGAQLKPANIAVPQMGR